MGHVEHDEMKTILVCNKYAHCINYKKIHLF